jgi:hypothetical protein
LAWVARISVSLAGSTMWFGDAPTTPMRYVVAAKIQRISTSALSPRRLRARTARISQSWIVPAMTGESAVI